MNTVIYNIPVNLVPEYRGRNVIVRSENPAELVKSLSEEYLEHLVSVQLLSMTAEVDALADWGYAVPVELIMIDPQSEFALLYRHAKLLDKHPMRVSIPATAGLSRAVKVANSLQFTVKIELGQPLPTAIQEILEVVDFYLHHSSVSQPIEFFHTTLMSFYEQTPVTLWDVQGEDPVYIRYITDDGQEAVARRPAGGGVMGDLDSFVVTLKTALLADRSECCNCEYFENCGGYFKWPRRDYECNGVKVVFRTLKNAAEDLKQDLKTFDLAKEGVTT